MINKKQVLRELQTIPGVGKSIAGDLWNIGIRNINELKHQSPKKLYARLNAFKGVKNDVCVLYTFRCVVYFATENEYEKEKLKWWYWKDKEYID